jgi:hypothetical protein
MFQIVDREGDPIILEEWDECATHGKEHMVYLRNLKPSLRDGNGFRLPFSEISDGTWVCRACTGEEYFKQLQGNGTEE